VLFRLRQHKLYAKLLKCAFLVKEIDYLGFMIGVEGVSMDPHRVSAIVEWPMLRSFRDVQSFLGFANFYRMFIWNYSGIVAPLTDLLVGMEKGKKKGPFKLTPDAEAAFHQLKDCFTHAPLLAHYEWNRPTRIEVDALGGAVGGVIS